MLTGKLLLKKTVSEAIFRLGLCKSTSGTTDGFRALNYHSITDSLSENDAYQMTTPRQIFEDHMAYLKENHYSVVTCDEAVGALIDKKPLPPRSVCITFDDGFKDNLTNAVPILKRNGFRATIFLTADYVGKSKEYLDWDEVGSIARAGAVSFGAHTMSHRRLRGLDADQLHREIVASKRVLEDRIGVPVDLFAYPFGSYGSFNRNTKESLRSNGYKAAFTTVAGFNKTGTDVFALNRTRVSWYDDEREFEKQLSGSYDWYRLWQMMARPL
jgi:peptidoglycan/xylan/chitin deacetylase (PgdA/CDA1 family)